MSEARRSYLRYLTPAAFIPPATEVKQDIFPYAKDVKLIATYPKKDSKEFDTEKKPFEDQFNQLLDAFSAWGTENKCDTGTVKAGIAQMKSRFFDPDFSGMQSPLYFETIKENLEKILLGLRDEKIPLAKRQKVYTLLCPNLSNCGPSLYTYTDQAQSELFPKESLEAWLMELRTSIIDRYADGYTTINRVTDNNSIHVNHAFAFYAADQKWSSTYSAKQMKDPFVTSFPTKNFNHVDQKEIWVDMKPEDLTDFHSYFENEYNPTAIRACIEINVPLMISSLFARYNFDEKKWNDTIQKETPDTKDISDLGARTDNYGQFIKKLRSVFKESGLTFSEEEFFEYGADSEGDTDYSKFRLRDRDTLIRSIVDTLCNRVLNPGPLLYFDQHEKRYRDLVPAYWLHKVKPTTTIFTCDFDVWKIIPNEEFPDVLFRLLNEFPEIKASFLLDEISKISPSRIIEMTKILNTDKYVTALTKIEDEDKRALITKKISTIVSKIKVKEEREEKDEKGAVHRFFPGQNKDLDKLLLHVVHGEERQAEAIIEKNPKLLLDISTVKDYSGRKIRGTALQIALGAEDVEMCQMIIPYLDKLDPDEKLKQYQKQFPLDQKEEKNTPEMKALEAITKTIFEAKENEITAGEISNLILSPKCQIALDQFRNALEPKGVITTGKHFNARLLLKALKELYSNAFLEDKWKDPKNILFWCQVIGYIQRLLPACYAQAWCQGIYPIVEYGASLTRTLIFYCDSPAVSFFPMDLNSRFRLGYDYAVGSGVRLERLSHGRFARENAPFYFKTYIMEKQQDLQNLIHPYTPGMIQNQRSAS